MSEYPIKVLGEGKVDFAYEDYSQKNKIDQILDKFKLHVRNESNDLVALVLLLKEENGKNTVEIKTNEKNLVHKLKIMLPEMTYINHSGVGNWFYYPRKENVMENDRYIVRCYLESNNAAQQIMDEVLFYLNDGAK